MEGVGTVGARIGPNAILRMAEALDGAFGAGICRAVFDDAGLARRLAVPPQDLVPDDEVARLNAALFARLGADEARPVARAAGALTGDYLCANRIPKFAALALAFLPRGLAARLLSRAIAGHAWTFAGRGRFSWRTTRSGLEFAVGASPLCRHLRTEGPACDYYAGTFERLFARLIDPHAQVEEVECAATGAAICRFAIRWPTARGPSQRAGQADARLPVVLDHRR